MNIPDPNETLTIFGREVKPSNICGAYGWETAIGELIRICVERKWSTAGCYTFVAVICYREDSDEVPTLSASPDYSTRQGAAAWAEKEVRRLLAEAAQACGGEVAWTAKQNGEAL